METVLYRRQYITSGDKIYINHTLNIYAKMFRYCFGLVGFNNGANIENCYLFLEIEKLYLQIELFKV